MNEMVLSDGEQATKPRRPADELQGSKPGAPLGHAQKAPSISAALAYCCPACSRRHVVLPGRAVAKPPRCICGAVLRAQPLASGVYEVRRVKKANRKAPRAIPPAHSPETVKEEDLGYGESHGYGPSHGGPSGPGDAPAAPHEAPSKGNED